MENAAENKVIMPTRLTAENGAKSAMIGEFYTVDTIECPDDCDQNPTCEYCSGSGWCTSVRYVSWDMIKDIYKFAVNLLGEPVDGRINQKASDR